MVSFFDRPLGTAFVASGVIHTLLLGQLSLSLSRFNVSLEQRPISVQLLEVAQPAEAIQSSQQPKDPDLSHLSRKVPEKLPASKPNTSPSLTQPRPPDSTPLPATSGSRPAPDRPDVRSSAPSSSSVEPGDGQRGDIAMVPGRGVGVSGERGTSGGGGDTPPNPGKAEKGLREARPLQTVRASYPPMALRMGLEADVVLKIQVDTEGKVIKAEIIKSAGMGFDEEALKAVRQFRFEPARKDGKNIPSESTYIYRFRLEK